MTKRILCTVVALVGLVAHPPGSPHPTHTGGADRRRYQPK
jgi:hypothetical protein